MRRILFLSILFVLMFPICVFADTKAHVTVYSDTGLTKLGTSTRYGICATGNEALLGKYVILYQRLPDESKGECLGIFHVEDTGCGKDVIDVWCPPNLQQCIKERTYENGCGGKVYVLVL